MNLGEEKNPVEEKVLEAAQLIEEQIDAAIEKLENLDTEELTKIRRDRLAALKKDAKSKEEWAANGHGEYTTLPSEREFFNAIKKSDRVVLHCYRSATMRCAIVDKHLDILARKHLETKFCKMDVEKAPFLCARLEINVIPTILLVKGAKDYERIVGFDAFGGVDDFSTEMMEWRFAKSGILNYDGDLTSPPEPDEAKKPKRSNFTRIKKNIRGDAEGSDSDSDGEGYP